MKKGFIKVCLALAVPLSAAQAQAAGESGLDSLNSSVKTVTGKTAPAASKPGGAKPATSGCSKSAKYNFGGAYFRKLVTHEDPAIVGIQAEGTLPLIAFDEARYYTDTEGNDYKTGPLDRPSVYTGASSPSNELDCGLGWDRVYLSTRTAVMVAPDGGHYQLALDKSVLFGPDGGKLASGSAAVTAMESSLKLKPLMAFRPFWRTTGMEKPDWHNPPLGAKNNIYFYPGERIKMALNYIGGGKFRLYVSAQGRDFSVTFAQKGFERTRSFKRINSIDQFRLENGKRVGNEGHDVVPTKTRVTGASWSTTSILLGSGAAVPFSGTHCVEQRGRDTNARYSEIFRSSGWTPAGGETLDITP
ncbi:MAG TPA: hypothetical protein DCZ92_05560 [Elusimicrobia bacterium]|nr:MAG: hypothetical protein A2016_06765 [Elusimicrobia bacterium GWF2_62_30]HBA60272.1 hypothetical protein [Elusimicrobiota bacterium]